MKKYIIFDIDRTIINSYESEMVSLKEVIKRVTGRDIAKEDLIKLTALPTTEFFKSINISDDEIPLIDKEWGNILNTYDTLCFPGVKDVIKELNNIGYTIGVVTSRTMGEFLELKDELSDVMGIFKAIVTSDKIVNPKPNKESMDYLCNELNCKCSDVIYIGDNNIDLMFSINSGVSFIPAVWENKELSNQKYACFDPKDIIEKINLINRGE